MFTHKLEKDHREVEENWKQKKGQDKHTLGPCFLSLPHFPSLKSKGEKSTRDCAFSPLLLYSHYRPVNNWIIPNILPIGE